MTDEPQKPSPGTWGAVVRSETPMPWRQYLKRLTFTSEEWSRDPGATLARVIHEAGEIVKERP